MLTQKSLIAVCSRSFSRHDKLKEKLLSQFPNTRFNDEGISLQGDSLIEFLKDADGAIVALEKINKEVLKELPNLKLISKYGVGLDNVDQIAIKEFGKCLAWTPGVNKRSVSELVITQALTLLRKTARANQAIKDQNWHQVKGHQLTGKNIGIIGFGNIGQDIVKLFKAFDCNIFVNDIKDIDEVAKSLDVSPVDKETIYSKCDVITIHTPLTPQTQDLFNQKTFDKLKEEVILINTARGGIINEHDIIVALDKGKVGGVALDVFIEEPLEENSPLINHPHCIVTPHIGGSSYEAIYSMGTSAIEGLSDKTKLIISN